MSTYIPVPLRRAVVERAQNRCEYCGKPPISFFPHEVDHIIAEKHGGDTSLENLAFACFECNRHKGSNIASFDPESGALTLLFNPRQDLWPDHFRYERSVIVPLTAVGRTTISLLRLNDPPRIAERIALRIGL